MKLKKLFALALAGVMAVSMLAGCSGSKKDGEVTASAVVAGLSEGTTKMVAFKESSSLNAALQKAAEVKEGESAKSAKDVAAAIAATDTDLSTDKMATSWTGLNAFGFPKEKTFVAVVAVENTNNMYSASYMAGLLADAVDKAAVGAANETIANLPATTNGVFQNEDGKTCRYDLTYTGTVAVVTVGDTSYAAFTVTRAGKLVVNHF